MGSRLRKLNANKDVDHLIEDAEENTNNSIQELDGELKAITANDQPETPETFQDEDFDSQPEKTDLDKIIEGWNNRTGDSISKALEILTKAFHEKTVEMLLEYSEIVNNSFIQLKSDLIEWNEKSNENKA